MHKTSIMLAACAATLTLLSTPATAGEEPAVKVATISSAKTAADHEAIARTYESEADRLDAEAATHAALAKTYGSYRSPKLYSAEMEKHCNQLAHDLKDSALLDRKLAGLHRKIAQELNSSK